MKEIMMKREAGGSSAAKLFRLRQRLQRKEEEALMNRQTRSNISATTVRGMTISVRNARPQSKVAKKNDFTSE